MTFVIFLSGTVRASRVINTLLLESVLGSTLRSAYYFKIAREGSINSAPLDGLMKHLQLEL